MKKHDFNFDLPDRLIARYPLENRSDSRLLVYHSADHTIQHSYFCSLVEYLEPGDLLIMNNSKVVRARLYGKKITGGRVELLVERVLSEYTFLAHIKASKSLQIDSVIFFEEGYTATVLERREDLFYCKATLPITALMETMGHIPLPHYFGREEEDLDKVRYQTIYAEQEGSVAAPTAGLHFDEPLLNTLQKKGVQLGYVTLHVGAGTFRPVRTENIHEHRMHAEQCEVSLSLCEKIAATRAAGRRVIAVGTTTMRSLETAARDGVLKPCQCDTDIFITPGYTFNVCDALITNFHLPESTLLMLVSAFIGHSQAMALYALAIQSEYRFFSYGDAMLLLRK